jgi:predicted  nucleic acid-binding Zn-ribbon protein
MNDETANVVLEHLRRIRASQDRMELDVSEMKSRMSALEQTTGQVLISIGTMNQRMDRFDERLSRIEKRLDLIEA